MILLFLLAAANFSFAAELGFSLGNHITVTPKIGKTRAVCHEEQVDFSCRTSLLKPADQDFFQGPIETKADRVGLKVRYTGGGGSSTLTSPYASGRSSLLFPLHPKDGFLKEGLNAVSFVLLKDQNFIEIGDFFVNMERAPIIHCAEKGFFISDDTFDCVDSTKACAAYFSQHCL